MNVRFRPIDQWPGARRETHLPSPFSTKVRKHWSSGQEYMATSSGAKMDKTLALIESELTHLGASEVVIQVDLQENQIRLDGWPKATAKPAYPGVILSFESRRHGWLSYPCDRFDGWVDNLYAIGLALEALRKVDRYGVAGSGQQYSGWRKIGAVSTPSAELVLATECGETADWVRKDARRAYLLARKRAHPDAGGTADRFHAVQQAGRALGVL